MPRMWETDTVPEINIRPQESINKQILHNSDIMIAMFWTKLGSPTGKDQSGTVEEINQFISSEKPVALYFSDKKYSPSTIDPMQLEALRAYQSSIRDNSYYNVFKSTSEIKELVLKYLNVTASEITKKKESNLLIDIQENEKSKPNSLDDFHSYLSLASHANADGFWLSIVAGYDDGYSSFNTNEKEYIFDWATTVLQSVYPENVGSKRYGKDFVSVTCKTQDTTAPVFQVRYDNVGVAMIQWRAINPFIPLNWLITLCLVSVAQVVNSPIVSGQRLRKLGITLSNSPEEGINTDVVFSSSMSDVHFNSRNSIWTSTVDEDVNIDKVIKEFVRNTLQEWGYYDFEDSLDSLILKNVKQDYLLLLND